MRITVIDYLSPKNHIDINMNYLEILQKILDVQIIAERGFYDKSNKTWLQHNIIEFPVVHSDNKFMRKLNNIKLMYITKEYLSDSNSIKLALSFDTLAFSIGRFFINSKNLFLVHHKNIDELRSRFKYLIFKSYMNKVNHIVFEDYFKKYLVESIGVNEELVHVVPHPVKFEIDEQEKLYDCVGLSNSNDEDVIKDIINIEQTYRLFAENKIKVILRSKIHTFDNGYLKIIKGSLEKEVYDNYLKKAKLVFVPLPSGYIYRLSGTIINALAYKKIVISNKSKLVEEYHRMYPRMCYSLSNAIDIVHKIVELNHQNYSLADFEKFKLKHCDDAIIASLKKVFHLETN